MTDSLAGGLRDLKEAAILRAATRFPPARISSTRTRRRRKPAGRIAPGVHRGAGDRNVPRRRHRRRRTGSRSAMARRGCGGGEFCGGGFVESEGRGRAEDGRGGSGCPPRPAIPPLPAARTGQSPAGRIRVSPLIHSLPCPFGTLLHSTTMQTQKVFSRRAHLKEKTGLIIVRRSELQPCSHPWVLVRAPNRQQLFQPPIACRCRPGNRHRLAVAERKGCRVPTH
jgi:hypothetical protein